MLALTFAVAAWSEDVRVFREGKVSEQELVDALEPPPRARNIRPMNVPPPAQGRAGSASAPLLITFEVNSSELSERARSTLDVVARALESDRLLKYQFSVEGHADPRGTEDGNMRLSQARADSVAAYLAKSHNIDPARLQPVGKGDTELLKPDDPTSPDNRRVTIKTVVSQ